MGSCLDGGFAALESVFPESVARSLRDRDAGLEETRLRLLVAAPPLDVAQAKNVMLWGFLLATPKTAWHEYWIEITPGGTGTHQVSIYLDGDTSGPVGVFDVTAGNGNDSGGAEDFGYIALGLGSTGQYGAIDVDFFAVKIVPEPGTVVLAWLALVSLAVFRRRR
ncbi:MAG: hypothetical protein JW829_17420 [Pirellulales bacterium]|nr:hypothetical protein [Pirellulales bacterium]